MQKGVPPSVVTNVLDSTAKFYKRDIENLPKRTTVYNFANEMADISIQSTMFAYAGMPQTQIAQKMEPNVDKLRIMPPVLGAD